MVLDVRRDEEYSTGHVADTVHIPLHDLLDRLPEVPEGTLWVPCGSGYRAGVAAAVLQRAGRAVVHVDAAWPEAAGTGIPVVSA